MPQQAPPAPTTPAERELEIMQEKITEGEKALDRMRAIAYGLWEDGMSQREITARLDRADRRAGGAGVTQTSVQKFLNRMKRGES